MFLKRLETIGFKSFAERISIEFVPGITTIVGPNGSGKSNIIDAIRWVLGEQSVKSLRGQKMEDIIFQGSDTRKPLNFAEVSLILNNEDGLLPIDYQEVKVTRRVYRSGESEFLINKQSCRLKDIVDLFTDTGLGRESFSIIGQGKIDEILSSKAEERRAVFEEAAGVMRYKKRKQEASFKLKETEDNLSRVEDIIHEISQQIEPLKIQAEVAKQYKALQNQLTEKEVALLVTEIDDLHNQWSSLLEHIEVEKLAHIERQTAIQQIDATIVNKRAEIEQLENKLNASQARLLEATEQLEQSEGKRNVLIEQRKHREENKQTLLQEQKEVKESIKHLEIQIVTETEKLNTVRARLNELKIEMTHVEEKLYNTHEKIAEEIESLKSDYIDLLNEKAVLNNEQNALQNRSEQIKRQYALHENNHADLLDHVQMINTEKTTVTNLLQAKKQEIQQYEEKISVLNEQKKNTTTLIENEQRKWYEINERITKLSSRKEMLVEMKKNFQGFAYGVKEILQANKKGILPNIYGAVIDLIEVPAKYMIAIDTILGSQAQYVVVPDDETARRTIHWLKQENKGRATFLPIQSIIPRNMPDYVRQLVGNEPGFIGIASELIDVKNEYKKVAEHLMGNVIVTDTLEAANQIAVTTSRKYRIVTLEGDVVYPGGSISGGAQRKRNFSLFTREKEIDDLTQSINKYNIQLQQLQNILIDKRSELEKVQKTLEKTTSSLTNEQQQLQQLINKINEINLKAQSFEDRMTTYEFQKNQYEEELAQLKEQLKLNHSKFSDIEQNITTIERTIEEKTNEQKTLQQNEEQNREKLHELQLENAEHNERLKNHQEKVNSLTESLELDQEKLIDIEEKLRQIEQIEQQMENVTQIEEHITELRNEREQTSQQIVELQKERKDKLQIIEDEERELKSQQKLLDQEQKNIQEKEIEANRLDVMLENRLQTLQKQYTMTYEKASAQYEKVTNVTEVRTEVNHLKNEIKALGTVNLGAIDEYERLSERAVFLNEQRDDLIAAKETLYKAIKQMDEEMISRFKETFHLIQENFAIVFKQLFGGGYAELVLTEPEDYLETGIDIIARPPGKKLKTLELLSGGERALTAIALLFAILRSRPVPFVILDEVDAALDEANVERFASYLKSFSKESQFVVISHRKGTMEEADALYGVTMQESGVSRFVSVRLEEADKLVKSS